MYMVQFFSQLLTSNSFEFDQTRTNIPEYHLKCLFLCLLRLQVQANVFTAPNACMECLAKILDYAVAKDYQCIGANQWSISGPIGSSPSKILGFYGSRQLQGGTAAMAFLLPRAAAGQVVVVACVSAHLEICSSVACHGFVYICSYCSNQKQGGCDESATTSLTMPPRLSGFSCLIRTTSLCEAACEKRLAEWKRDHAIKKSHGSQGQPCPTDHNHVEGSRCSICGQSCRAPLPQEIVFRIAWYD